MMRLLGIDPGLRRTGWGVISVEGNRLSHIANGVICADLNLPLAKRLAQIHQALEQVIKTHRPHEAAVEETFVNKNPLSTLKLGQARGVALLAPAIAGLIVAEYPSTKVKKSIAGAGHAAKDQIRRMISVLLPGCGMVNADSADALAIAICHAHYRETALRVKEAIRQ